jgi:hypothetical protein
MLTSVRRTKFKSQLAGIGVAISVFLLLFVLVRLLDTKYRNKELLEAVAYGNLLRTQVERELNSLLFISNGTASYITIYKDELDPAKIKLLIPSTAICRKAKTNSFS